MSTSTRPHPHRAKRGRGRCIAAVLLCCGPLTAQASATPPPAEAAVNTEVPGPVPTELPPTTPVPQRPAADEPDRYVPPGVNAPLLTAPANEDGGTDPVTPAPLPQLWSDADDLAFMAADGAYTLCSAALTPVTLIPFAGPPAYIVAEWACIVPAAFVVDDIALLHGGRNAMFWEAAVSLSAAKAFRDVARLPAVSTWLVSVGATTIVTVAAVLTGGLVATPLNIPPEYQPIALTGTLTSTALLTAALDAIRGVITKYIFRFGYQALTAQAEDEDERRAFRDAAYLPEEQNILMRAGLLTALAAGSQPDFSLLHLVPVAGRVVETYASAEALRERVRRLSADTFNDERTTWWPVDSAIYLTYAFDAGVGILADLAIIVGAAVFATGSSIFVLERVGYAPAEGLTDTTIAALGGIGVGVASAAIVLLAVQDVKEVIGPLIVTAAYGPVPDDLFRDEPTGPEKAPSEPLE